jgi:predicted metal-binding protein
VSAEEDELIRLLRERLLTARTHKLCYQVEYEETVAWLACVRIDKCISYGENRYDPANSAEFNQWMCYSDVYRKFIRLEQQMKNSSVEDLIETYSDLANYAIMAVQLLERTR